VVPGRRTGGLSNMQTRASLIRADLRATPGEAGQGTRLELSLSPDLARSRTSAGEQTA
jgi:signal transduction histidine kinase